MLEISDLRKAFDGGGGSPVLAIDGVDLDARAGSLLTMLGPSGCGKTTTLRCIAGLERPDTGRIVIGDRVVVDTQRGIFVPPSERSIGMVFQSYAIWPHMSVFENVAFPLRVARGQNFADAEVRALVGDALEMVRLGGYERRRATQLSGGQQQRLAFARGIVRKPTLLLLDEPLSNLDARLRDELRGELMRLQARLGLTTVYVTHDQAEALALSDEIALFRSGRVVQRGAPADIYHHPASRFVAEFIGAANFLACRIEFGGAGVLAVRLGGDLVHGLAEQQLAGGAATLAVRPETIRLSNDFPPEAENVLPATIGSRSFFGDVVEYVCTVGEEEIRVRVAPTVMFATGQPVFASFAAADCRLFPA